ncbi:MAG TPA: KpsF/GutQ family sugar-phosphate isomerase [Pirellulales bacterium]|nr:KpsF/GutQ family sugar-phosphate isomerase [Pirellulales bacterium]
MSMPMRASTQALSPLEQLRYAREIIQLEGHALTILAQRLDGEFNHAVDTLYACQGSVIASGMGKAGLIAQKVAATLASTGTRSHFLHPAEAVHGDLGRIHDDDVLVIFSQSGETEEIVRLLPSLADFGVELIAITARRASTLGRAARVTLELGPLQEACALGLAPSTSTTAMLALGDALALVTSRMRDFRREDFARFHPAGSLGRQLSKVDDFMRPLADCRVARESKSVREVFVERNRMGRRTGAIMLIDGAGKLAGLFTDSDLARLFEGRRDAALDSPIREVMTFRPATVPQGSMMADAVAIMAERKISELPVIDSAGRPQGLIDITDVVGLFPEAALGGPVERSHHLGAGEIAKYPGPPRPTSPFPRPGAPSRDCA